MRIQAEQEVFFMCPYCWTKISMVFDASSGTRQYIEDCEVCCKPIVVRFFVDTEGSVVADAHKESE